MQIGESALCLLHLAARELAEKLICSQIVASLIDRKRGMETSTAMPVSEWGRCRAVRNLEPAGWDRLAVGMNLGKNDRVEGCNLEGRIKVSYTGPKITLSR